MWTATSSMARYSTRPHCCAVRDCGMAANKCNSVMVSTSRLGVGKQAPQRITRTRATDGKPGTAEVALTGIVFQPFNEVKPQLQSMDSLLGSKDVTKSYARVGFQDEAEAGINQQINIEFNIFYVYQAMWAYFDRDNVGLPGFAAYFRTKGEGEREHAQKLMRYQNTRGGRVKLAPILQPTEHNFEGAEKGDALYSAELALALEKLNFQKLRDLHDIAVNTNDASMADFIEGELLQDQVQDVKDAATFVSQVQRAGQGHGVFHIDLELYREYGDGTAVAQGNGVGV